MSPLETGDQTRVTKDLIKVLEGNKKNTVGTKIFVHGRRMKRCKVHSLHNMLNIWIFFCFVFIRFASLNGFSKEHHTLLLIYFDSFNNGFSFTLHPVRCKRKVRAESIRAKKKVLKY